MLEKDIESKVCAYARERGLLAYKFTSPARAAVPDRLFIVPGGVMFFCEFKRQGQKPTPAQEREHKRLREYDVPVFVVDNVDAGMRMVNEMLRITSEMTELGRC
jgi:hypothetical protein